MYVRILTRVHIHGQVTGDFSSPYILSRIADKRYDFVFHLAAMPRVEFSVKNPILTNENNVSKTVSLMSACCGNVKRFIFSSSSAIYGDVEDNFPSREDGKNNPKSPYALQKKIIEDYCSLFYDLYNLESVCLRYFNVYGPGQLGDSPYSTAVSSWMNCLRFGKTLRSDGDGEQTRDMIYIDDVVKANIKASQLKRISRGEVCNVGSGRSYSNKQILSMIESRVGNISVTEFPEREGDVKHTKADIKKTEEFLGFKPETNFEAGLEKTLKWWELN